MWSSIFAGGIASLGMKLFFGFLIVNTYRVLYLTAFTKSRHPYRRRSSSDNPKSGLRTHRESLNASTISSCTASFTIGFPTSSKTSRIHIVGNTYAPPSTGMPSLSGWPYSERIPSPITSNTEFIGAAIGVFERRLQYQHLVDSTLLLMYSWIA